MLKKIPCFIFAVAVLFQNQSFAQNSMPACFQNLETQFFKYEITSQAFSMNRIDQSLWTSLVNQLQQRSQEVPNLIQEQAQQMRPNPLQQPIQVKVASQLLHDTLFAVFRQVMLDNYITLYTNEVAINEMFRYIWLQQLQTISQCLGTSAIEKYIIKD
jgi:hypothetical protein